MRGRCSMRCEDCERKMDAFRTGEVDTTDKTSIEQHLEACSECADEYHEIEEIAGTASSLLRASAPSFVDRVLAAIAHHYDFVEVDGLHYFVAWSTRGITAVSGRRTE